MKRLYKNRAQGMISGVCAGIAEYFSLDVSIVRIIWAITFTWGGLGLFMYIICAIVLPDKSQLDFADYTVKPVNKE